MTRQQHLLQHTYCLNSEGSVPKAKVIANYENRVVRGIEIYELQLLT